MELNQQKAQPQHYNMKMYQTNPVLNEQKITKNLNESSIKRIEKLESKVSQLSEQINKILALVEDNRKTTRRQANDIDKVRVAVNKQL